MAQPDEFIARMSRDRRLDAFNAKNKQHLFKEFLWKIIHEAEMEVLKDTKARVKEQDITLAKDARAVNLPNDFLIPDIIRYKDSSSDALAEGIVVRIVPQEDLL